MVITKLLSSHSPNIIGSDETTENLTGDSDQFRSTEEIISIDFTDSPYSTTSFRKKEKLALQK